MTERTMEPSSEETDFNIAMRVLVQVAKSEIEELERQEAAKVRAGSATGRRKRRKTRDQAA